MLAREDLEPDVYTPAQGPRRRGRTPAFGSLGLKAHQTDPEAGRLLGNIDRGTIQARALSILVSPRERLRWISGSVMVCHRPVLAENLSVAGPYVLIRLAEQSLANVRFAHILLVALVLVGLGCAARDVRLVSLEDQDAEHCGPAQYTLALAEFDRVLRQYVDADGRVDYATLADDSQAIEALDRYLQCVARLDLQQLLETQADPHTATTVLYLNVHNAAALRGALTFYPIKRLRDCPVPFDRRVFLALAGQWLSLEDVASLCESLGDPRVSFAPGSTHPRRASAEGTRPTTSRILINNWIK